MAASGGTLELRGSGVARPGRVTVLVATPDLVLGEFRCLPDDELWQTDNDIGDLPHVVWPLTTVEIERAGFGTVCADPNTVVLYNPGTAYRRRRLTAAGDRSLFLALSSDLLERLPSTALHADGERFATGHVLCSARSWLHKETLVAAARSDHVDPMRLEEMALDALYDALDEPTGGAVRAPTSRVGDRVEQARMLLGHRLDEALPVTGVARALGVSPFHLARQFRAVTGTSMYAYRQQLRIRAAVRQVLEDPGRDLSAVAAEHGFASHSHFTATCRRAFGRAPTGLRASIGRASAADQGPTERSASAAEHDVT
jgi:AraC-like DNA-binding protein